MSDLTHFDAQGNVHMVDVGHKEMTSRLAKAEGRITMNPATLQKIQEGAHKKGDVLGIARVAGIMAAKQTSTLVPLCHPLTLTRVAVDLEVDAAKSAVICTATTETHERTGVEMEALTAVQITLLTIYDMCKAVDRGMELGEFDCLRREAANPDTGNGSTLIEQRLQGHTQDSAGYSTVGRALLLKGFNLEGRALNAHNPDLTPCRGILASRPPHSILNPNLSNPIFDRLLNRNHSAYIFVPSLAQG